MFPAIIIRSFGLLFISCVFEIPRSLEGLNRYLRSDQLVDGVALSNLHSQQKMAEDGVDVDETIVKSAASKQSIDAIGPESANHSRNRAGGDDGSRTVKPVFMTSAIKFSASGHEWAAATTEGLQVFALDDELIFAPDDLSIDATPSAVYSAIKNKNYGLAVTLALKLSLAEMDVLTAAVESVPVNNIEVVVNSLHPSKFRDLFKFLSQKLVRIRDQRF